MILMKLKKDTRRLDILEREFPNRIDASLHSAAEALVLDIRSNWSPTSPSDPGSPPAILTGNMDSAVKAESQGRDDRGRFQGPDAKVWYVTIKTSQGENPLGRGEYAAEVDQTRPFIEPALDRVARQLPFFFRRVL